MLLLATTGFGHGNVGRAPARSYNAMGIATRGAAQTGSGIPAPYELGINSTCPAWIPPPVWILLALADRSAFMLTP